MKRSLNLIPNPVLRRQAIGRLLRLWTVALLSAGSLAGLLVLVEWARGLAALDDLKRLDERYAPLVTLVKQREEFKEEIELLRAREQTTLRLATDQHSLSALAAITLAAAAAPNEVYLEEIDYQASAPQQGGRPEGRPVVRLTGASVDSLAVARFAERLRTGGGLASVSVESTAPLPGSDPSHRRFQIVCQM
ncbi:hypothetical protein [Botrimarina sp.]|uniref:hypothetical protein n=1 Tax=Botrimarina sp. TaxID=2795802 RepID=UPI0032ED8E58